MDKPVVQRVLVLVGTIGTFRISVDGDTDVAPRSRKARGLLALLALESRPLSRERLVDLLWSDRETEQARSSLRQTLFEVRHANDAFADLIAEGRDGLSLNPAIARSDLQRLEAAATQDDWTRLLQLLKGSGSGLVEDLDGLDPEFDNWLRLARAGQPGHTLSVAIDSAQRCLDAGNARQAMDLAAQLVRLDPSSESATRLAMAAAYAQGDRASANRLFRQLESRLAADFGIGSSQETRDLLRQMNAPDPALAEAAREDKSSGAAPRTPDPAPASRAVGRATAGWMLAGGLAAAAALTIVPRLSTPTPTPVSPLVAVVPFEELPASDGALAEGLWDDTRTTLSRTGAIRVLGRTTSQAFARQRLTPADYRRKLDVDYLLDGSVRRDGERVRVTVSLLRTADGVAIWEHAFDGRLGDPIALQGAIAQGIEGRIRGRLASGGGAKAVQIPTSPEVYELYVRSKLLLKQRVVTQSREASVLLDKAIRLDPNFAPAWALAASADYLGQIDANPASNWRANALAKADRAIELAPNLGEGYAISALIDGLGKPSSLAALQRSVRIDPGDEQAWLWLGNAYAMRGDRQRSNEAYRRSIAIDPYFAPPLLNLFQRLLDHDDRVGIDKLTTQLEAIGAGDSLAPALRAEAAYRRGDVSGGLKLLLPAARRADPPPIVRGTVVKGLLMVGELDQAVRFSGVSGQYAGWLAGRSVPPLTGEPRSVVLRTDYMMIAMRNAERAGQSRRIADLYRAAFPDPNDLIDLFREQDWLEISGPTISEAMLRSGMKVEGHQILAATIRDAAKELRAAPRATESMVQLARPLAVAGRVREAIDLLAEAHAKGWLPDGVNVPADIALDPAFSSARQDPAFQSIRKSILNDVARERREVGPIRL